MQVEGREHWCYAWEMSIGFGVGVPTGPDGRCGRSERSARLPLLCANDAPALDPRLGCVCVRRHTPEAHVLEEPRVVGRVNEEGQQGF